MTHGAGRQKKEEEEKKTAEGSEREGLHQLTTMMLSPQIKNPRVCFILKLVFIIAGLNLHPAQPKRGQIPGELSDDGFRECRKSLRSLKTGADVNYIE
jgi:hypothetical protein